MRWEFGDSPLAGTGVWAKALYGAIVRAASQAPERAPLENPTPGAGTKTIQLRHNEEITRPLIYGETYNSDRLPQ